MSKAKEPEFVAKTLAWCNSKRKKQGKKPLKKLPKGKPMDGHSCPCGRATGLFVNTTYYHVKGNVYREFAVPLSVGQFVEAFDIGALPQYELKS